MSKKYEKLVVKRKAWVRTRTECAEHPRPVPAWLIVDEVIAELEYRAVQRSYGKEERDAK